MTEWKIQNKIHEIQRNLQYTIKYIQMYDQRENRKLFVSNLSPGRRGLDRMVVGFTIKSGISACHHYSCEFEPRSSGGWGE